MQVIVVEKLVFVLIGDEHLVNRNKDRCTEYMIEMREMRSASV